MRENTNLQILGNVLRPFEPATSHAMDLAEYGQLRGLLSQRDPLSLGDIDEHFGQPLGRANGAIEGGMESFELLIPTSPFWRSKRPAAGVA